MKTKEFAAIERKLLPYLQGFVMKGKLLFTQPVDDFLRGIYFENSSGTNDFYVRMLYLALFIPQEEINFIHAERIRRNNRELWHADDPNLLGNLREVIQDEAIPFLNSVSTLAKVIDSLKTDIKRTSPRVNSHYLEELSGALIKSGDFSSALEVLGHLKRNLLGSTTPWVVEQRNRAHLIEGKLLQDPQAALAQLETWKKATMAKLGLEAYQSPEQPPN